MAATDNHLGFLETAISRVSSEDYALRDACQSIAAN